MSILISGGATEDLTTGTSNVAIVVIQQINKSFFEIEPFFRHVMGKRVKKAHHNGDSQQVTISNPNPG